jgi:hypothetical protein
VPGFGSGSFGSGGFGAFNWSRQVLFLDMPRTDRRHDADDPLHPLENFSGSIRPAFEELLTFAYDFDQIRDPDSIRTKFQDNISVTITAAAVEADERTTRVTVNDPDPNDPFNPLYRTSIGWKLIDDNGDEFTVNRVHKLSNAFTVVGKTLPALGAATLRPPSLIGFLGQDYGLTVDQHNPEAYQRSAVRNAFQWLAMKGVQDSYDIIGKIAGYRVVALGLWKLPSPPPTNIPADRVFEAPLGSGNYYTDLNPTMAFFDEVAADVIPTDMMCWEEPDWTTDGITPPPGPLPDGTSVYDAIASYTAGLSITSTTDLGDGFWRIEVNGGADLWPIAGYGYWYANFTDVGADSGDFYLEGDPVDLGGGSWTFDVYTENASPVFGTTVDIRYACHISLQCSWCRASVIRVEMRPEEILTDPEALLDNALQRMVDKILLTVPIHVRVTDLIHIVGPVDANVYVSPSPGPGHLYATGTQQAALFAYASVGYYYDIVEADAVVTDPPHIAATGSQFTIP